MEFHQLEYVLAVAKFQSFTKASEEINVSQSSLSIQIRKLEAELGVRLFERTTRSVLLTAAGKEFMPYAERILLESKEVKVNMEQFISADQGNIFIGVFPGSKFFGFIDLIADFKKRSPKIKFDIYEAECSELLNMLKTLDIDVAFLTEFNEAEGIRFYPLIEDRLVLVVKDDHHFSGRTKVTLEEISREPLILNEVTTLHRNALDAFSAHGLKPNIELLCTHGQLTSLLGFVESGLGTTLISSRVSKSYTHWGLSFLEVEPPILRKTYLAVPEVNERRPIIQNFVQSILQGIKQNSI